MNVFVSDGARLAYRIDGLDDAPTLVLINSLGTNLRMWNPQVALLSHALRIVRYDCRGHGASDVPSGNYTIEQLGRDLLALLDTLQIEQAHICGLSLGGLVALWFAVTYPNRVARAVFANTASRIGTTESWNTRIEAVRHCPRTLSERGISSETSRHCAANQCNDRDNSSYRVYWCVCCSARYRPASMHERDTHSIPHLGRSIG